MKTHLVATISLGLRPIRLFIQTENECGLVKLVPTDGGPTNVIIGISGSWASTLSVLLHELYEATLIDLNTRYTLDPSFSKEASDLMFLASHNQLSEAHERVARTLDKILPDLSKAYKKYSPYKKG